MVFAELDFGSAMPQILPKMWLQIVLAFFMTGMIIMAFRFMYKSLKEQQKMAALKNDFISNMTHELKTPIATVSVALEALKNFSAIDNPQRTKEYLDISSAELNRLSMLVDKVLRINMFEAEKLDIDKHPVDLAAITAEVLQAQQLQADKIGAVLQWNLPGMPVMVKGDKLHLMSVLYNLLDNAMKYRSQNPEIKVYMERKGEKVYWSVQDNGPGIAAEYKARVFEKFFRVPQGDRHDIKGYGLGLSYVHDVVQKHGGTISVESEPGKGSIFTVELPVIND
jgi:two-component system phosphate regulon sensor histidine kinase PhoR